MRWAVRLGIALRFRIERPEHRELDERCILWDRCLHGFECDLLPPRAEFRAVRAQLRFEPLLLRFERLDALPPRVRLFLARCARTRARHRARLRAR